MSQKNMLNTQQHQRPASIGFQRSQMRRLLRSPLRGPQRQRGLTGIAIALILVLIAFFAMVLIRLFPVYMEHFNVTTHLKSLAEEVGASKKTNVEIIATLVKRFDLDDVKHVTSDDIFIEREKGGLVIVAIEYEVRTPAMANIDMVVSFVDEVELQ
ncbi:MAG: DUF4845 domain-containing protein [Ectothiorhodospiraceae bacterium]|nr:DUF4845 domain-containing protein [Ectothiorhodospiraceae bacterium]